MVKKSSITLDKLFQPLARVSTDKCLFIPINLEDAEFIFNLRKNHEKSFLRKSDDTIESQRHYIQNYFYRFENREEIYYKVLNKNSGKVEAVVRLTELNKDGVFNWESLISVPGADPTTPIDIMLTVYKIGFDHLGKEICGPWDVDRQHTSMQKIHKIVNMAKRVGADEHYFKYSVDVQDYRAEMPKYKSLGFAKNIEVHYDR